MPSGAERHVLIVDDSATMRRMVRVSLRGLTSVVFHEAANGLEAIERLALGTIDLMVVDLNMPGFDEHLVKPASAPAGPKVRVLRVTRGNSSPLRFRRAAPPIQ